MTVTVAVPTLDEEAAIGECLERIRAQTWSDLRIVVADGGSRDRTREIVRSHAAVDDRVQLIDNPRRRQAAGLNEVLDRTRDDVLVRVDARSFVAEDHVSTCVELLERTNAACVGGRMVARLPAATSLATGIALANGAWWGAGPAAHHSSAATAGPADTVYLGAFRSSWLRRVGGWAEDVGVNEDYELNFRLRSAGAVVWFDPSVVVGYEPRSGFGALAKQYFRYGRSKAVVMTRHPGSIRPRQLFPVGLGVAASALVVPSLRRSAAALIGLHVGVVATLALQTRHPLLHRLSAAAAALVMHWSWSAGFWRGLVRRAGKS